MDALRFYDVENITTVTATLDIGTVAPASSDDTPLRIQNTSDTYQAEDVTVSVVASTGPDAVQLWLSTDGEVFSSSIAVGDVAPTGITATFWLRRVTASDTTAGSCFGQLSAVPTTWSLPVDTTASVDVALPTED